MAHSVEKHLAVAPDVYDVEIRRFIPGYDEMLDEAVAAVAEQAELGDPRVIDLGTGTGALAARIAAALPLARLILLDADQAMLEKAAIRLHADRDRLELRHGLFSDPLPAFDAAVASLSLHHLHTADEKRETYRRVHDALAPGGVLVSADVTIPAAKSLADPLRRRWARHLVANGDTESQAYARFAEWAKEDRYFGVDEELDMLRAAGFAEIDVRFRFGPSTVVVARR
jgi:tRNA (cmo5U34)-methyltransferase